MRVCALIRPSESMFLTCMLLTVSIFLTSSGQSQRHRQPSAIVAWGASPGPSLSTTSVCPGSLNGQTVRNIVQLSAGGSAVRIHISNIGNTSPLRVSAASVSLSAGNGAIVPGSSVPILFTGVASVLIPAQSDVLSDLVALPVTALQSIAVDIYFAGATGPATVHYYQMQPLYLATGNQAGTSGPFTTTYSCSMFVTSVDVAPPANLAGAVIALGDSITDGTGSTAGANHRYTDYLAQRFAALTGTTLSVTNAGIVGNAVLDNRFNSNGSINVNFGTPALARLGRDVLLQSGASAVLLLEGINDIGADDAQASDIALADEQIVIQAHAAGLKVYAGTLPPFGGSTVGYGGNYGTSAGEAQRQLLNQWIRTGNAFDGIVDFDQVLADPANPINLLAAYDSGDHLHPNDTGYQAMANAIDINGMIGQILASQ